MTAPIAHVPRFWALKPIERLSGVPETVRSGPVGVVPHQDGLQFARTGVVVPVTLDQQVDVWPVVVHFVSRRDFKCGSSSRSEVVMILKPEKAYCLQFEHNKSP